MKHYALILLAALMTLTMRAQYVPTQEILDSRQKFEESRFGIFIHWGIYSMLAQGEWCMTNQDINYKEYAKLANAFYPHDFNAQEWVKAIKESGAKYITFTSRHHDGFSMWDTKQSGLKITNTPYGKDIITQLADACHKEDISLHLYYSHIDWSREDYPAGRVGRHTGKDSTKADWPHYYKFMNRQLTELLTKYGKIGCIWFDGWWDHDKDSIPFDWQLQEQYKLIHDLQPSCLVANNHHQTPFEGEDIQIFERDIPGENKAGLSGQSYGTLPLETCQTMNGMWGYKIRDLNYKSATELIQLLVRTSGKGANLLLNIGPQPDGKLPDMALQRLKEIGKWLKANGETIYGTKAGSYAGEDYVSTKKGDKTFLHILKTGKTAISIPASTKVKSVVDFKSRKTLKFTQSNENLTITLPDNYDSVDYIVEIM